MRALGWSRQPQGVQQGYQRGSNEGTKGYDRIPLVCHYMIQPHIRHRTPRS